MSLADYPILFFCPGCGNSVGALEWARGGGHDEMGYPFCESCMEKQHEDAQPDSRCAVCRAKIVTGELCAECAAGNDPFFASNYSFPKEYS